jgi:outer membrane protein, heavy metal efflux system
MGDGDHDRRSALAGPRLTSAQFSPDNSASLAEPRDCRLRVADQPACQLGSDAAGTSEAPSLPMLRIPALIGVLGVLTALAGCARYRHLPLPRGADLAPSLAALDVTFPTAAADNGSRKIDVARPLDLDEIGLLVILNNPDLKAAHAQTGVAEAKLLQASLLPNPSASLGYGALIAGPGTTPSYIVSLSEDLVVLVTRHARVAAARAQLAQVRADLLWQAWQMAQKARVLALDIYFADRSISLERNELGLVSNELHRVQQATAAGNLTLAALSPLLAAKAAAEQSLVTGHLDRLKAWQALDALLGLVPEVRFAISAPELRALPPGLGPLIQSLPERRSDLIALRLGYRASEADVRAAILAQFPAFVLGGSWGSDTTGVVSAGPNATFDLPIFNRNQGQIAQTRATRILLQQQYQARLDSAVSSIRSLAAQVQQLAVDLDPARQAAAAARSLAQTARAAYAQGNLDQRSWTDYETTALQRELEVVALERNLGEDRILLTVELGLGLPDTVASAVDGVQPR